MDIRQLKYFISIAETRSFSASAQVFCLTQSAISQQIKALETELRTELFDRTTHSVTLTDSGILLLPMAKKTVETFDECKQKMSDMNEELCGELSIGLTYSLEPYIRPAVIDFMSRYPGVLLNISYQTIPELMRRLRGRELDMAFCISQNESNKEVDSVPLLSYKLCAIMRSGHPLAKRKELTFDDLRSHTLILPERGIRDRDAVERYANTSTGHLQVKALVNDVNAIVGILRDSNYVSILAQHVALRDNSLTAVNIKGLSEPIMSYAHFARNSYRKRSANAFLETFREISVPMAQMTNIC